MIAKKFMPRGRNQVVEVLTFRYIARKMKVVANFSQTVVILPAREVSFIRFESVHPTQFDSESGFFLVDTHKDTCK